MTMIQENDPCCCGSNINFGQCCEPLLAGKPALTAEALMRSRYSAFACDKLDYLKDTLSIEAQGEYEAEGIKSWVSQSQWLGLEIRTVTKGMADDTEGSVEFVARYKLKNQHFAHHELALFAKDENGIWKYIDGNINPQPPQRIVSKVGRNDPCPCDSGKKYKKCCGHP